MTTESNGPAYLDTDLTPGERADDLIARMTLDEKVGQMRHESPAIERLGIAKYNWWNECLHGVARAGLATVFPQSIGMAASFNEDLLGRAGAAISDEARAKHHATRGKDLFEKYFGLTFWSPNINIFRDPRWGRGQETYGEDPFLTARLGVAFIKGLQGDDPKYLKVAATAKHYAVHSGPESLRHEFNAVVSQRDLRETYLYAFEAAVREGRVEGIMGAYNRTNGEPCCASPTLLQKILRGEWGFDGHVVSDCGGVNDLHKNHRLTQSPAESAALAVKNGLDLNCGTCFQYLAAAVHGGLITEAELDVSLRRLMITRIRLGMFDPPQRVPYTSIPAGVVSCDEHVALARQAARESIVLLKNNGVLPLSRSMRGIGVFGPVATDFDVLLGNYNGHAATMVTLLEGLTAAAGPAMYVNHTEGCHLYQTGPIQRCLNWMVGQVDVCIATVGITPLLEGEEGNAPETAESDGSGDRIGLGLPGSQKELLTSLKEKGKPLIVVVTGGSPLDLRWAQEHADAVLMCWYPGQEGGRAIGDVIFGDYNPAGRLPLTFPESLDQLPPFEEYSMAGRTYRFMEAEPLYRFGYGLSYTTFAYDDIALAADSIRVGEAATVSINVTNTGDRDGDEVVQLYLKHQQPAAPAPRHSLKGFRRIHLAAGETRQLTFTLTPNDLSLYDDAGKPFVNVGSIEINIGGGQPDDPTAGGQTVVLKVKG